MSMNVLEIYNNLYAGKFLEVEFASKEEAMNFRNKLGVYKFRQDKYMISIGMLMPADCTEFSFITNIPKKNASEQVQMEFYQNGRILVKMAMREKPIRKLYTVRILGEEEATDNHTEEDIRKQNEQSVQKNIEYERVEYNE